MRPSIDFYDTVKQHRNLPCSAKNVSQYGMTSPLLRSLAKRFTEGVRERKKYTQEIISVFQSGLSKPPGVGFLSERFPNCTSEAIHKS
jgi:hypothetical protein